LGSASDPAGGDYSAPPDALAGLKGPTSKERGRDMGWEGRKGREDREGGKGEGSAPPIFYCTPVLVF